MAIALLTVGAASLLVASPTSEAVHFWRGEDRFGEKRGCSAATGNITDDGSSAQDADAIVYLGHNSFHDNTTLGPVTEIEPGDTVTWVWNSEHCHSVSDGEIQGPLESGSNDEFESGFVYPAETPDTPLVADGFFDHPIPAHQALDDPPTLAFSHTFDQEGTYTYACVHHGLIGMVGTVIVEAD